jgi:hypothetical protein
MRGNRDGNFGQLTGLFQFINKIPQIGIFHRLLTFFKVKDVQPEPKPTG